MTCWLYPLNFNPFLMEIHDRQSTIIIPCKGMLATKAIHNTVCHSTKQGIYKQVVFDCFCVYHRNYSGYGFHSFLYTCWKFRAMLISSMGMACECTETVPIRCFFISLSTVFEILLFHTESYPDFKRWLWLVGGLNSSITRRKACN